MFPVITEAFSGAISIESKTIQNVKIAKNISQVLNPRKFAWTCDKRIFYSVSNWPVFPKPMMVRRWLSSPRLTYFSFQFCYYMCREREGGVFISWRVLFLYRYSVLFSSERLDMHLHFLFIFLFKIFYNILCGEVLLLSLDVFFIAVLVMKLNKTYLLVP